MDRDDLDLADLAAEGVAQVDPGEVHYDRPVDRFRRSAVGSVLAAGMFGLADVLEGRIDPGRVFDRVIGLDEVPDGYRAMNDREAIKVMVMPS